MIKVTVGHTSPVFKFSLAIKIDLNSIQICLCHLFIIYMQVSCNI